LHPEEPKIDKTFFALYSRQIGRKTPIVKSVPELSDLTLSTVKGERISFKGIEFEVPWNDVDEQKTRVVGTWALIHFRSGTSMILCVVPPNGFIADMAKNKTPDPELFMEIYGQRFFAQTTHCIKRFLKLPPGR
jgi:hypothetical protein